MVPILGVDVSRHHPKVDWKLLRANGVEFALIKATQGDYFIDKQLCAHLDGAQAAGLRAGLYHWCDPLRGDEDQLDHFLSSVRLLAFDFAAVVVKQYWADWREWRNKKITRLVNPGLISESALFLASAIQYETGKRTIIGSNLSMLMDYSRPMMAWIPHWPLWIEQSTTPKKLRLNWEHMRVNVVPRGEPVLPKGSSWRFWQFSGGELALPGCSVPMNLDLYAGSRMELDCWLEGVEPPEDPAGRQDRLTTHC